MRVYCYLRRIAKWRGLNVLARNRTVLRHNLAFHSYVAHSACYERAKKQLKDFLCSTQTEFSFIVLVRIHHRRMESI